jgi:membrane-associated protein
VPVLDPLMPLLCSPWLYLIVFAAVTIDGFLPVMPSEAVVIGLGALSATGSPELVPLGLTVVAGGVAGDRLSYLLGQRTGGRFRTGKLAMARERAERALHRYGAVAILVGRFLPYGRTATTVTSGAVAMPLGRFRILTILASTAWAAYTIGLGRIGGEAFSGSPLMGVGCGLLLGGILTVVHTVVARRRSARAERREAATPQIVAEEIPRPRHRLDHLQTGHPEVVPCQYFAIRQGALLP